ncbi:MAG: UbiA family prenyltransferase [Phycisphaerales bacterium]|nr:UbiA family prenyltransferase [Phycisphaerales bacterium]
MTTIETPQTQLPFTQRLTIALGDIKLAHSVFALPFAILAAFLVAPRSAADNSLLIGQLSGMLVLIIICMIFARTWAMLVNRVADAKLDAANERTKNRAFASGKLSLKDGYLMLSVSALGFIAAASCFGFFYTNWLPAILSIPVLIWIGFYSFTKRFTFLCHVFLGGALAASPIAAAIAINPSLLSSTPEIYTIAIMVLFWVAGFDIIYALQDLDHDQSTNLNSIPAKFGWKRAIWIARAFHTIALAALVYAWSQSTQLTTLFAIATALTAALLLYEHAILAKRGKAGIPIAFFTLNGIISLTIGALGSIDIILF